MTDARENLFWDWLVPALVSLGLFFSIATQLRMLTGGTVGPGEMMLSGVAGLGWLCGKPWRQLRNPFLWFWGLLAATMSLGALTGNLQGNWVMRNTQAYVFTGFVVVGFVSLFSRLSNEVLRRILMLLCVFAAVGMWFGFSIYLIDDPTLMQKFALKSMGDMRYSGWSENPNQLALMFIPLPFWLMGLWQDVLKRNLIDQLIYSLMFISLSLMGLLLRSDGLLLSWTLVFIVLLVLRFRWHNKRNLMSNLAYVVAIVLCILMVKVFANGELRKSIHCAAKNLSQGLVSWSVNCHQQPVFAGKKDVRIGFSDPSEKADIRHDLWKNGLMAWREAPLFGHGPGAFSGYSFPERQQAMRAEGKVAEEAHNITIDLMTQGGVLLGAAWLALILYLLVAAWRVGDPYTFGVMLMLGIFTAFHYHVRQPYLWFELILSYEAIRRQLFVNRLH